MEVEKRSSKGGFFQLFDWNAKSRKKLFSNKSELPECSNQGKDNSNSSAASRLHQMKMHEIGPSASVQGNDYNCISSVSVEDWYGAKAPGVVARLMGLESLPTSDVSEPYKSPFFDSHSFRDSYIPRTTTDIHSEHIDYDNTRNKLDGLSRNPVHFRMQKVQNRSIDRFQTEILPPKSARSISSTHHRLLSPIKSPGFILTKNAASIMEAAAKIINQSPKSTTKGKLSSFGSPSVPLRIRDLKEKLQAAQKAPLIPDRSQRAKYNRSGKYTKGEPSERGQRGSEHTQLLRQSIAPKQVGSRSSKNKDKSPSFSNQPKTNVHIKEGLPSSGNRSLNQKGDSGVKPNHIEEKQLYPQKSLQKRTLAGGNSDVLKQNNQKQNCVSSKETICLKPQLASYQQGRKVSLTKSSNRVSKIVNKITENSSTVTKKKNLVAADTGKEISSSNSNGISGKKRPVNGIVCNSGAAIDDASVSKKDRSVKCNVSVDGFTNWDAVDRKSGNDVVSFTFTSPIKKSLPGSQASFQFIDKNNSLLVDPAGDQPNSNVSYLSSLGLNVIGSDALSVLLEQKLKELACRVEPSNSNLVKQGNWPSTSSLQETPPSHGVTNSTYAEHKEKLQLSLHNNEGDPDDYEHSSCGELMLDIKRQWQESDDLEESSNARNGNRKTEYEGEIHFQYPTAIPSQPSYSGGSCNSLDSRISYTSNGTGNRQCSSLESCETVSFIPYRNPQYLEDELELSDSASSLSVGGMERKDAASLGYRKFEQSSNWEIVYVNEVLDNVDLMFEDYILGQIDFILTPDIFDNLENQKNGSDKVAEEYLKLERKIIFDCLNECLEFRCERIAAGSYKAWIKLTMCTRKERLAEEMYREMSSWTSMKDLMVDDLVDKDMSSHQGKWVDFETEEYEESSELSNDILGTLVDELVTDMLS